MSTRDQQNNITTMAQRLRPFLLQQIASAPAASSQAFNKILLISSGTADVSVYAKTAAGLTSALTDASSGDTILLPGGTISGDHTVPSGVTLWGYYYATVLSGTITNNGVVFNVRITGSISNGGSTAYYRVVDGQSIEHTVYGTAVDLRWQFGYLGVTPSFTAISLDASGKAAGLIAGTQGGGIVVQNDAPVTFSEDSRANFLADAVGNLGGGTSAVMAALFPTTGNMRLERTTASPLYSDPGYKLYVVGTHYRDNYEDIGEISKPGNPSANFARFYAKDDGGTTKLFYLRSDGTEVELGASSGPHNILSSEHTDSNSGDTPAEGDALVYRSGLWEAEAQSESPYWEPAVVAAGSEIMFTSDGDVAMLWIE